MSQNLRLGSGGTSSPSTSPAAPTGATCPPAAELPAEKGRPLGQEMWGGGARLKRTGAVRMGKWGCGEERASPPTFDMADEGSAAEEGV